MSQKAPRVARIRAADHFFTREHHLLLGQAHAVCRRGDFKVIMTTMKLNHAYLTFSIAAVCSGYLDSLNDASPQLQRSWQGLGRVLTPLSTRAGPFRAVMTAVKTTNTSPHACALGCV